MDDNAAEFFADILDANRDHRDSFSLGDLTGVGRQRLAVLPCLDTRIDPLAALGLRPGDAKIARNAGARVTDDAIRSLALTTALLGVERIAVIQHTDCALVKSPDDVLRARVAEATGADTASWEPLAIADPQATLEADAARLRTHPLIGTGVIAAGFVYS